MDLGVCRLHPDGRVELRDGTFVLRPAWYGLKLPNGAGRVYRSRVVVREKGTTHRFVYRRGCWRELRGTFW